MLKLPRTTARHLYLTCCMVGSSALMPFAQAQIASPSVLLMPAAPVSSDLAAMDMPATLFPVAASEQPLPDAPGFSSSTAADDPQQQRGPSNPPQPAHASGSHAAGPFDKYVSPQQTAPRLTHFDKVMISAKDTFSLFNLAGVVISAGYSQVTNGSPNYGTNGKAFAQRLGAGAARNASESFFSDAILANVLHEDPRYYTKGRQTRLVPRVWYAATRTLVTRTDSGRPTPNLSLLGGYLGASALTQVYYPPINQGGRQLMITYGGALGGAALGFIVAEFSDDLLEAVHLKRKTND